MLDVLEDRTLPSITNWTGLGMTGNWSDSNNWDNDAPGPGSTAVFAGGSGSTVDEPFDIDGIIMAPSWHGLIHVSHDLSMSGASTWSSGDISVGNGVQWINNGTLTISVPSSGLSLGGLGTLVNTNTIVQTGPGALPLVNCDIDNQAGALYDLQADTPGINYAGSNAIFTNEGTLQKSQGASGGTSTLDCHLTDTNGTIHVATGTLIMDVASINFGSSYNGTTFSVDGTLDSTGTGIGSVYASGTLTGTGSGAVRLAAGTLAAGTGGAVFHFDPGLFQWTGGTVDGNTNGLTIAAGSSLTLAGSATKTEDGALTNSGTIAQTDSGNVVFNGTLNNQAGALYDLQSDASMSDTLGRITNAGTFRKSGGTVASIVGTYFDNPGGIIEVQTGTLNMRIGGSQGSTYGDGSTFVVGSGAALELTEGGFGNVFVAGTLTGSGSGTVRLSNSSLAAGAGGATFNFPSGLFQWTGGTLDANTNGLTIAAGSFLTLSGVATKKLGGTLTNQGTMIQTDAGLFELGSGIVNNQDGAVYDLQSDAGLDSTGGGTFVNTGVFRKSGGTGTSAINSFFNNPGTVEARSGTPAINFVTAQITGNTLNGGTWNVFDTATLTLNGGVALNTNNGNITLSGASPVFSNITRLAANAGSLSLVNGANFTTTGNFSNTGILVIGPASVFTVTGNYTQGASGTLDVQLGDVPANGQFGQLAVTGQANLGGTLQVDLVNGYTPNSGDSFTILVFGTRSGDFATLNLPTGGVWDPNGGTVSF